MQPLNDIKLPFIALIQIHTVHSCYLLYHVSNYVLGDFIAMIKKISTTKSQLKKRFLVCATFALPLFITSGISNQAQHNICQDQNLSNQAISQCLANTGANNSWLTWLTGGSRSTQFQMIDLFELVNRPSDDSANRVLPTREG